MTTPHPPRRRAAGIISVLLAVLWLGSGSDAGSPAAARDEPAAGVAMTARAGTPEPTQWYRWPLDGVPRPVRRFDPPPQPWQAGHRGVDLAAEAHATVRAAGGGTVSFAGPVAGRPVIAVVHPNGLRTTYEPVRPVVAAGARVTTGDRLGVLLPGHAGCPAVACLHWGLRRGEEYLDPLILLGLGRVRLLPAAGRLDQLAEASAAGRAAQGQAGWASSAGSPSASLSYSSGRL